MRTAVCFIVLGIATGAAGQEILQPTVPDSDLELSLLAREPEVVTPTGLAADREGRLYVVESHTHARDSDYQGRRRDRILVFEDTDGDGRLDRSRTYADGLRHALAAAFSRDGELYVVQMKSVVALRDRDDDGVCETQEAVVTIETPNNNNHGVFLALAFDERNRLYVSLGNIGGNAYTIIGSDGSRVTGQGDTGLIVRMRADGSQLERFAHGFWNPCDLKFDTAGRLLATDNDPDSRGPNRVLHVIPGGEYGYKSRFGPQGLHPFCAWNGELPGTLPMLAGVGEAPVGVLDCNSSSLPETYADDLLACIWGTNQVVRIRTRRRGTSLSGRVEPLLVGDRNFRPTSIVATADGTVYIADWVDRRYPVHGKGRIWRLTARAGTNQLKPQAPFSLAGRDPGETRLRALRAAPRPDSFARRLEAAQDDDPFVSSTAVASIAKDADRDRLVALLGHAQSSSRLVALLALRKSGAVLGADRLRPLLTDPDPDVRRMTMIWLGETMRLDMADALRDSLTQQTTSPELFETFLAASQLLTEAEAVRVREKTPGNRIDRRIDQELVRTVLTDASQPPEAAAMALRYLTEVDRPETIDRLFELTESPNPTTAVEAVRTLSASKVESVVERLQAIARDANCSDDVRCEAIMAVAGSVERGGAALLPLLVNSSRPVALTAARALTSRTSDELVRREMAKSLGASGGDPARVSLREQLRFALQRSQESRPAGDVQWKAAVAAGGDAAAGRRVFFDRRVACSKCHRVDGRGGRVGPDLSRVASAKTPDEILASILHPSREKSPDYQGYVVVMQDGRIYKGTQFHFRGESAELWLEDGGHVRFKLSDTEQYRALDVSLMPDDLVDALSVSEFCDLFAFLTTLRDDR